MTVSVLVTDGEQRSSLAAVRSLGRSGYRVYVCSGRGRSIAGASRYAVEEAVIASSLTRPENFANDLAGLIARWSVDVLLPMTEQSFNAIYRKPGLFAGVRIPAVESESFRAISDKQRVLGVAEELGLRIPAQRVLSTADDARRVSLDELHYPLVMKPARSVAEHDGEQVKLGVRHCATAADLRAALDALPASAYPVLLQQRVVGPGVGVFLLIWDGKLVAHFAHRRLREKPPSGGVSVYRESIIADAELLERSRRLLERFDWRGVAMIEYKVDEHTGDPYLMEINGRFWGSLQLAIDAGVDFPALLVACALGRPIAPPPAYRTGIRSRWEWGDVDHVLARLRRSDAELSMPPGSPSRFRALMALLVPWRPGDRLEVLRLSDPRPFLRETALYFRGQ